MQVIQITVNKFAFTIIDMSVYNGFTDMTCAYVILVTSKCGIIYLIVTANLIFGNFHYQSIHLTEGWLTGQRPLACLSCCPPFVSG